MTPRIRNGDTITITPVTDKTIINVGDVVFCKVRGNFYFHKVVGIRKAGSGHLSFLIGNNHGHINGWTTQVYGKVLS